MNKTLSVCMITKNEEKNISRCLESIKDIADEIIIVDTGSTDNTIEIAESFGANVYNYKWRNDFSDARNKSLEKATKDWILFLDADEELPKDEAIQLKNIINITPGEGLYLRLVNIISNIDLGDAIVLRAFKNNPKYRFRGKMHEQIVFSIQEVSGVQSVVATELKILHYGYDPEVSNLDAKQKRNLDLLNSYPECDRDGYFYYSLGNEYARVNDSEKALEIYYKALNYPVKPGEMPSYMPYLIANIARTLSASKRFVDEIDHLQKAEKKYNDFRDLYFFECLAHIECSKFTKAKECLLKYLNTEAKNYVYPNSNFEEQYNMGILLKQLRNSSIPHKDNLISVLILATEDDDSLATTVKTVNEIAYEVVIVKPRNSNLNRKSIENVGAKVLEVDNNNSEDLFMNGYKSCSGEYLLLMRPKEVCSLETQKSLTTLLNINKKECLNLLVIDTATNLQSNEFRLFRNTKQIKKFNSFDEFSKFFNGKNSETYNIYIHKIDENFTDFKTL